jgi:hypothetical protein
MSSKISITTAVPLVDVAPRVEGSGTALRYEFRCLDDLVTCLEKGTFVLDLAVKADDKFSENGRLGLFLKGRYSDHGVGMIYFGLKKDVLQDRVNPGSTTHTLHYELLEQGARNYNTRKEIEDTVETYARFLRFVEEPMSRVRAQYYPDHSESLHIPKILKFKAPKGEQSKTISKDRVDTDQKEFNIVDYVQSEGKVMVRVNLPWLLEQKNLQNMMIGVSLSLARWKYLTDSEKVAIARRKEDKKRAEESKRKRDESKKDSTAKKSRVAEVSTSSADSGSDTEH